MRKSITLLFATSVLFFKVISRNTLSTNLLYISKLECHRGGLGAESPANGGSVAEPPSAAAILQPYLLKKYAF